MAQPQGTGFIWWHTAVVLGATLAAAGIAWALVAPRWGFALLALGFGLLVIRHLANLAALVSWLRDPAKVPLPIGSGAWEFVFSTLYRQTRAVSQQQHRLTGLLARFRMAGQAMPDGVVILDRENHIEWANANAERYLGIDSERDIGQQLANLVRHPEFVAFLDRGEWNEPLTLRLARGDDLVLSIRIVPYGQDEKLLLARDVTQAEKLDIMRRDFVANVSHELKTPLTVMSGFLETLSDGTIKPDSTRGHQALGLMREQAERMQRLVKDLLTLSVLESSTTPTSEMRIDVDGLLGALCEEARALSAGRHAIECACHAPAALLGNEQELRSAFGNLVSNAIRYTPEGGRIALSWWERSGEGVFTVEDTGIGIEPQHLPRLTERFYRVDRSRSRQTGGTGLGLAIVKHVLSRHHASLEIESEPGRGSRFSAVFPGRRVRFRRAAAA